MTKLYDIDRRLNAIRAWMHYNGVTPHRISLATGLSPGALRDVFKDTWNPKTSTLRVIEQFIEDYRAELRRQALEPRAPTRARPVGSPPHSRRS